MTETIKYNIILGCIHIPFHDKFILNKINQFIQQEKSNISRLILLGDFLDLNSLSFFNRGQTPLLGINLGYEYNEGLKVIEEFNSILAPETKKIFMIGNHEDRYYKNIKEIEKSKYGKAFLDPIAALKLKETGWQIMTDYKNDYYKIKNIQLLHGEYWNEYASRKHSLLTQQNIMFAHTHRIQQITLGNITGYNIGCLLDFNSEVFDYAGRIRRSQWNKGFGIITETEKESFVQIIEIKNKSFIFNGKIY
jgi:predicted phosphodiesterase